MKKRSKNGERRPGNPGRRKPRFSAELKVLLEDDAIVVVDKPAGLPAVPIPNSDSPSAWKLLSSELGHRRQRAFVVHRIDRYTSGLMLFAKTERDRDKLVAQFLKHTPVREYLAVVRGNVTPPEGTLVHHLRREGMFQELTKSSDRKGARAELRYVVERKLRNASLVRVRLVTGLQNQIRVQFSAVEHPVIGDRKYHEEEQSERRIDRVALHASHLEFVHPRTGKTVSVDSEPPADFRSLIKALAPSRGPKQ